MIDINELLFEICDDDSVFDDDCELIESGILDSLAFIELFDSLEDNNVRINPTRIDRSRLKTPGKIKSLVSEYMENHE
ncbi:MAG: D-alanine--poly(phosphoribitol) ligase subunit 2 [Clostridiales bacterium]|nr:D-alanine--poly(phosphoribitol) ligase subunit 2 [Clostridiales bacterium]